MDQTNGDNAGAAQRVCRRGGFWCGVMLIAALAAPRAAEAATYRWQVDASGNWNDPANWTVVVGPAGAGYPNLPGDVAVLDEPLTAARVITIPTGVTIAIGRLTVASSIAAGQVTIARDGTGLLVFDNLGEDAIIETSGPGDRTILSTPVQLAAHVTVNGAIEFSGISEAVAARNITVTGGSVRLNQTNTYTGTTTVTAGELLALSGALPNIIPGSLVVGDGAGAAGSAIVLVVGDAIDHSADVQVNADGRVTFANQFASNAHTIDQLTVAGGVVSLFEIGTSLTVQDLTMEGGVVLLSTAGTSFRLAGSLTATSTAAGPAVIRPGAATTPAAVVLLPGNHTFTVADGPQAVDFLFDIGFGESAPTAGLIKGGPGLMEIRRAAGHTGETRVVGGTLQVNGNMPSSAVFVDTLAQLTGTGTVGSITTASNSTVSPGVDGPAILRSGSLSLVAGSHLPIDILGGTPGSGYDQVQVTGTVTITSAILRVTSALLLPPSTPFTIIDNDGADPVNGTFERRPEGSQFQTESGSLFVISYIGGDGNDVTLLNLTPISYFLSEGATGTFFDEDVLIANPNTVAAPITMTFLLPGGGTFVQQRTVPAQSRLTVRVDDIPDLAATSPAVEVKSDNRLTLAVERTMFWDQTHYGGHTANAVPRPEKEWLFAEGAQNDFFQTFLLLANPNPVDVSATVTFLRQDEASVTKVIPVPARGRETVSAGDHSELVGRSFGMTVSTPLAISAERAMYFASTPTRLWTGGHGNEGSAKASTTWFHPEGASGTFFSTFILVSNPQTTPAEVTLRFLLPNGETLETTRTIQAKQRITVNPVDTGDPRLANAAFSTVVSADVPVISERAMYWPGDDTPFGEGHVSSGLVSTALDWALAEGRVGGPSAYTTYILLANPQSSAADVTVTFLRETGEPIVKTWSVNPNSRFNIDVGGMVPELQNESFGARIEVTNSVPIAVERSMYWNAEGRFWAGGSNALANVIPR